MGRTYNSSYPTSAALIEEPSFTRIRNYMVYQPKLQALPGETRNRNWVWVQLAKRLGLSDKYCPTLANVSWDQWDATIEGLFKTAYETWAASSDVKAAIGTPPTWDQFKQKPYIAFPLNTSRTEYIPWSPQIQGGQAFGTPSGKIEFYSNYLADTAKTTADYYGGPIDPMPMYNPCWTNYWSKDEFNKYPLWVFNPHGVHRRHDFYDANPMIGDLTAIQSDPLHGGDVHGSTITMSAVDAKLRGINDGDMVRVFNDAGQAVLKAIVMQSMSPGIIQLPEGRWADVNAAGIDRRGGTDILTYNRPSPSCANPFNAPVQVEKF
jgi:anaerobic dimethyl sulfoxide reductase subunit A